MNAPNSKKTPTMKDVAVLAGVSQPTVSRFLNARKGSPKIREEKRQRIQSAIEQLGYIRNEAARELKSGNVIRRVAFYHMFDSHVDYFDVRKWLKMSLGTMQVAMTFYHIDESLLLSDPASFSTLEISGGRIGILMGTSLEGDRYFMQHRQHIHSPFLTIGRDLDGFHSITIDYEQQMTATLEYLHHQGCRRILYMDRSWLSQSNMARRNAYEIFCSRHNLHPLMWTHGRYDESGGYQLTHEALAQHLDFDSIVTLSDTQAVGSLRALLESGIQVPAEVRVIGYGDTPLARYTRPSLTSVPRFTEQVLDAIRSFIVPILESGDSPSRIYKEVFHASDVIRRESG